MLVDKHYHAACHEAAHAVVCLLLHQTFKRIRICEEEIPIEERPEHLKNEPAFTRLGRFVPTDEPAFDRGANEAVIALAGLTFEKLLRPYHSYTFLCCFGHARSDYGGAMQWGQRMLYGCKDSNIVESHLFKYLLPDVRRMVIENWSDIAAIGELLLQRGELSQAEVEAARAGQK
jgi:hypothetical protein